MTRLQKNFENLAIVVKIRNINYIQKYVKNTILILAGISISMLTGQNGILNRTQEAKEKTAKAQEEEFATLNDYEKVIGKYTSNLPSTEYTTPYLPDTEKFEKVDGTDLSNGLVIREKATGSEYVWVEVPKTNEVYPTAGINITNFTNEEYTKIENDLHTYTNDYRNGTNFSDTFYDASNDENEANKSDWFQSEEEYNIAKKKMLKSVYENGGFWVGRYEAGIETNRISSGTAPTTPLSKENLYPYTYVTRTQAKVLAEMVESGRYTSSLMFGVQWDLILKYIEIKKVATVTDIKTKLNSSSGTVGNYYNSSFRLNRGKFAQNGALSNWYDFNSEDKISLVTGEIKQQQNLPLNGILLTTGATEATNLQNIYDIAGNILEWTLENTSSVSSPCAHRGGHYGNNSSSIPASCRTSDDTSDSYGHIGFRVSLY